MKNWLSLNFLLIAPFFLHAQNGYSYFADLQNISNDKVNIRLKPPVLKESTIVYSFPRIIPGSYSEKNFGSYIEDFTVTDTNGKSIKTKKLNENQYEIKRAHEIASISYKVNDTWDRPGKDFIFQPGGTNIAAGSNVVMNNHAFFGYFEGYLQLPFKVLVNKPAGMYAASHLNIDRSDSTTDRWYANSYFELVDNPVFYAVPDTTSFTVGSSTVNVAVISATGKIKSKQVAAYLEPLSVALGRFYNGLPVAYYQFLFYFEDPSNLSGKQNSGGYGALEHNYCSLYFLPEIAYEKRLKSLVLEVAGHEFLHILTPLNLHSEEIEYFDFIQPKMSRHLWLYEGVTEYFAQLIQLQNGLLTPEGFFSIIRDKINASDKFGNFSLTEMSEHVLEPAYKNKYSSVYNKGALTAMMLDLLIREKTNGDKDLKSVIKTLAAKYGPGKPFKDDALFGELVAASHPAVQSFINDYIVGEAPLPYNELFGMLGYDFWKQKKINTYFTGQMALKFDEVRHAFVFTDVEKRNALAVNNDDVLISVNEISVTDENLDAIWERYFRSNTNNPEVSLVVKRDGAEKNLTGVLFKGTIELENYIEPADNPGREQMTLRHKWLTN